MTRDASPLIRPSRRAALTSRGAATARIAAVIGRKTQNDFQIRLSDGRAEKSPLRNGDQTGPRLGRLARHVYGRTGSLHCSQAKVPQRPSQQRPHLPLTARCRPGTWSRHQSDHALVPRATALRFHCANQARLPRPRWRRARTLLEAYRVRLFERTPNARLSPLGWFPVPTSTIKKTKSRP
jgi:hypothetical protein